MVDYRVSAEDRAAFKRCRRQWDFGSIHRQRLQPLEPAPVDLTQAVRDALAVYYYPGMWDWQAAIVLPLVRKAFMRSIAAAPPSPERLEALDLGSELLERYFEWAPSLDDFGPLKIEADVEVLVPDIREPERGLLTADGERVLYTERVAMVAADGSDEYWVVLHCVVPEWRSAESMLLDEAAIAACWAWEQTYLGMDVAGTIHNEIRRAPMDFVEAPPGETRTGRPGRGGYSQNEPSGGGRLMPQGQRPDHVAGRPVITQRLEQELAGPIRRTRIRRNRAEIEGAVEQIGAEVLDMLDPALSLYPTPSPHSCPECLFLAPCVAMTEGADPTLDLASRFQQGSAAVAYEPRLGSGGGGGRNISLPGSPLHE
ncbi:MAG: hypothetical protein M3400_03200 [Actinomycetota bacterium]|nr:hypothetical protein [Actinomycetota bacterium]